MCTAISYKNYFGRTLDLEYSYEEQVVITPRNYILPLSCGEKISSHYAFIGMATVAEGYPLYYDATNEKGLSIAALNFPDNAYFPPINDNMNNLAPFEFIPWILSRCQNVSKARKMLENINIAHIDFNDRYKTTPLHWIISDKKSSITVESVESGLKIYDNPIGILTNNPPFDWHITNLGNYINLSAKAPLNRFSDNIDLIPYSKGMGAMGLPGDMSSASRFIRAAFTKLNSVSHTKSEDISQFFHILDSVKQIKGCVDLGDGKYEITVYSSCCDTENGIYYYNTYYNNQICGVDMHKEDINGKALICYPLISHQQIEMQNKKSS